MLQEEVCKTLKKLGGREFTDHSKSPGTRSFSMKTLSGPNCACNNKPPALLVRAYPDTFEVCSGLIPGKVEFQIAGEAGDGRWLSAEIYSVAREEVEEIFPDVEAAATAMWGAFVEALRKREFRTQEVA
jgi:hypothetical protein